MKPEDHQRAIERANRILVRFKDSLGPFADELAPLLQSSEALAGPDFLDQAVVVLSVLFEEMLERLFPARARPAAKPQGQPGDGLLALRTNLRREIFVPETVDKSLLFIVGLRDAHPLADRGEASVALRSELGTLTLVCFAEVLGWYFSTTAEGKRILEAKKPALGTGLRTVSAQGARYEVAHQMNLRLARQDNRFLWGQRLLFAVTLAAGVSTSVLGAAIGSTALVPCQFIAMVCFGLGWIPWRGLAWVAEEREKFLGLVLRQVYRPSEPHS